MKDDGVLAVWPIKTFLPLWVLTMMCGHGDGWWRFVSCSPRGERFTHQTRQHPHIRTRTHMYKQEHTPIIPITRWQQGNSQQPDPAMESCIRVCVCGSVEPLGSQGPCRAFGVLIRQPQPSRVHHRENRVGREVEQRMKWGVYVGEPAKTALISQRGLWRERKRVREREWEIKREGGRKLKDDDNWNLQHAMMSPGTES